jgi:hypothetical protein
VPLFEADPSRVAGDLARVEEKLAVLPKMIRARGEDVDDEF